MFKKMPPRVLWLPKSGRSPAISAAAGAAAFALKVVFFGLICTLLLQKPKKTAKYLWKPEKNH